MEIISFLQKRIAVIAILAVSSVLALTWNVGKNVVDYASLYSERPSQVLGEATKSNFQCISEEKFTEFLSQTDKTITLYAPNKSINLPLAPLLSCFAATGCDSAEFSCGEGKVSLVEACVAEYFQKHPLEVEQTKIVSGVGAVAQVHIQDWTVNYANLAEQLSKAVTEEIKYCQVEGKAEQTRQNIGNIQLVVADELPGMKGNDFTKRFIEVDTSKGKLYFWNEGVYQTLSLVHGARLPKEAIYKRSSIDLSKVVSSVDAAFLERNSEAGDYVVIHN